MPELPEVETVCVGIAPHITGKTITEVTLRRPDIRFPIPKTLPMQLENHRVQAMKRRAKYILIYMDNDYVLVIHLGMSGKLILETNMPNQLDKHDHVLFRLNDGQVMVFRDPRRFGIITGCEADALASHPLFAHLGPEPLGEDFDGTYLYRQFQKRKGAAKPVLMDQKLVVGVGNIYASEALFRAGVNPERPANKISQKSCNAIGSSIKAVLQDAMLLAAPLCVIM
ncbi:MAG: bifunctional DNA-formamidopyrimidine glycosylase/DNA-(apurinic or apyrimidinic site) lyase [Rickettsiales bacterium]